MDVMCQGCRQPVNRGDAFVRSLTFRQVAWCPPCWATRHDPPSIPVQRRAPADQRSTVTH